MDYLLSLYDAKKHGFRFWQDGEVTLLSSCFGVQFAYLINNLSAIDTDHISTHILDQQSEDGLFYDDIFLPSDTTGSHSEQYITWQFTFFSLIALDMLGIKPKVTLTFLDTFKEDGYLAKWLNERDWNDFWYASNEIMFLLYFLIYQRDRLCIDRPQCTAAMDICMDYLDKHQDPLTGFWGRNVRKDVYNSLYGAAHIYLFYDYLERPIPHAGRIIDTTLGLQSANGLYGNAGGGACEDYDAVEILFRMYNISQHRKDDVRVAMRKTYMAIRNASDAAGGYSYRLRKRSILNPIKSLILKRFNPEICYSYSGWSKMKCNVYTPDLWGTYFRVLTMALIEMTLGTEKSFNYKFYALPGWGYYKKASS